jgi:hypothetical protein
MGCTSITAARETRQARAGKAVWGLLFVIMGSLFTLDELGRIDMKGPWPYPASNAVDGDRGTRWSSEWSDPQWITVDLGSVAEITRVRLSWEAARARAYRIEASSDGATFTPIKEVINAEGDIDDLPVRASGRYVRIFGTERTTKYGYSLWELEIYGPHGPLSPGRPIQASSGEGRSPWLLYWPLLLVGAGLPALLAPKDAGDQLVGLFIAGAGVLFQLQRLQLVHWTFGQTWPVLLILGGFLLVTQALRQMESGSGDSRAAAGEENGGSVR